MRFHLITLILFLSVQGVVAQDTENANSVSDPLGKPNIWESLSQNPLDSVLWTMYMGKPWVSMTFREKEQIGKWKNFLKENTDAIEEQELIASVDNAELWSDIPELSVRESKRQAEEQMAQNQYISQLESIMLEEPDMLSSLKSNIKANFVVIEATYQEEFSQLGVSYTSYSNKYPKGGYSQDLWVQEKSQELKQLKRKEFEKVRVQLVGK